MPALCNLILIGMIELTHRNNVINMPLASIMPTHTLNKLLLNVSDQLGDGASQILLKLLTPTSASNDRSKPTPKSLGNTHRTITMNTACCGLEGELVSPPHAITRQANNLRFMRSWSAWSMQPKPILLFFCNHTFINNSCGKVAQSAQSICIGCAKHSLTLFWLGR